MATPSSGGGDGWSVVLIAIAIVAGSKIAERVADYILPKGRHWSWLDRYSTRDDAPDPEPDDEDTPADE